MRTTTLLATLLSLAAASLTTPLPETNTTTTNNTHLARRSNTCLAQDGAAKIWKITVDDDAAHNKRCGTGCLDNIRGQPLCNDVTGWSCNRDDTTGTATYRFATPAGCTLWDVTQALKKCSGGETIDCKNGDFDGL